MDENLKEEILRNCIRKREGKIDVTWQQLAEQYKDYFKDSEAIRCWTKNELKKRNELPSRDNKISKDTENKLKELDLKRIELEKERKKVQTTKLEYNKLLRETGRQEMLFDEIKQAIKIIQPPKFNPLIKNTPKNKEGILSLSDIHFGKAFVSLTNEYSEDIVYKRMNKLIEKTVDICIKEGLNKLIIINGSDSIEGMCLRVSQLQNLSIGIVEMTIRFSKFMAEWLNKLSQYIYVDYYHVSECNHSQIRPFGTKTTQFPKEDMEKIVITYIHDVLKSNERIKVHNEFDDDFIEFKIFNYNVIAKHGHTIKNFKNIIKDLSIQHRKFYDYCYLGHVHHSESITISEGVNNNCELLIIPSIMGSDSYSDKLMVGAKAGARLDIFINGEGHSITYNINLN